MIVGSDRRHGDKKLGLKPRSDTIILVRIDPGKGVALLSLPRDLKVEIPGHGTDKINVAYTLGGPKLTIKTVKQLTGPRDQPLRRRQLPRLRGGRQRARLRIRRHRPPLLQQQRGAGLRRELRGDQREARLPEDVRRARARVRALPPHRQRHRARRAPAGLPAPGARTGDARASCSATTDKLIDIFADNTALGHRLHRRAAPPAAADARRARQADQAGQVPRPAGRVVRDRQSRPRSRRRCASSCTCGPQRARSNRSRKRSKAARKGKARHRRNLIDVTMASRAQGQLAQGPRRLPRLLPAQAGAGLLVRRGRAAHLHDRRPPTTSATAPTRWSSSPASSASTTACRARPGATRRSSSTRPRRARSAGREYLLFYNGDRLRLVGWKTRARLLLGLEHAAPDVSAKEMLGVARSLASALR